MNYLLPPIYPIQLWCLQRFLCLDSIPCYDAAITHMTLSANDAFIMVGKYSTVNVTYKVKRKYVHIKHRYFHKCPISGQSIPLVIEEH